MASLTMEQKAVIITQVANKISFYYQRYDELSISKNQEDKETLNNLEIKISTMEECLQIIQEA